MHVRTVGASLSVGEGVIGFSECPLALHIFLRVVFPMGFGGRGTGGVRAARKGGTERGR